MKKINIYTEYLHQHLRNFIYYKKNKTNPFGDKIIGSKKRYLELYNNVKNIDYPEIDKYEIKNGYKIDLNWLNDLALHTQIVIKKSNLCYAHGRVLYSALSSYINNFSSKDVSFNIIETGTSRGFSSICMAKALFDNHFFGKIITIDYLPHDKQFYWNCIDDLEGKKNRRELISKWKYLTEKYILFLEGNTSKVLNNIKADRIHFAFLDASHTYFDIYNEFEFICQFQEKNDVIVFDDYSISKYIGLTTAIDELCHKYHYNKEIIFANKDRGYVIASKI